MIALAILFLQTLWLSLFSVAFVQVLSGGYVKGAFYVHALFAYLWTTHVLKFILHTTIAGTISCWYFRINPQDRPLDVVMDSLKRCLTYYLGAICIGAFLIVPVELLAGPLHVLSTLPILSHLCHPLRVCTEKIYKHCNRYGFTHVITYGKDFRKASCDAWRSINDRGLGSIMAGDVSAMLLYPTLIGASCVTVIATLWMLTLRLDHLAPIIMLNFGVGVANLALVTEVVDAAITSVCACFAMAPSNLAETHPIIFHRFIRIAEFSIRDQSGGLQSVAQSSSRV